MLSRWVLPATTCSCPVSPSALTLTHIGFSHPRGANTSGGRAEPLASAYQ